MEKNRIILESLKSKFYSNFHLNLPHKCVEKSIFNFKYCVYIISNTLHKLCQMCLLSCEMELLCPSTDTQCVGTQKEKMDRSGQKIIDGNDL